MEFKCRRLCGDICPTIAKKYHSAKIVGPRARMLGKQKAHVFEAFIGSYQVKPSSPDEKTDEVLRKVMAKQKRRTFDNIDSLPKKLYREEGQKIERLQSRRWSEISSKMHVASSRLFF